MGRVAIKTISREPEKFIPSNHANDSSLDENAKEIMNRPMVIMVRKMSRDEQFKVREMFEFKDDSNPEKGLKGSGDVAKFIWNNNVTEVRNAVVQEADGVKCYESLVDKAKDDLWDTDGMDLEINEAILFARNTSTLDEAEVKN